MLRLLARLSWPLRSFWSELRFRGIRVPVGGPEITFPVWKRLFRGDYEKPEIDALLALLQDGDRILELGGGLGVVSGVALATRRDIFLQTHDGNPAMIQCIRALHALNGFAEAQVRHEIVLSRCDGPTRTFHIHDSFAESSLAPLAAEGRKVEVAVVDFATAVAEFNPTILVCDIEGAEAQLFDGIDLSGFRAVVVELHPALISADDIQRIFKTCELAGLLPRVDLAAGTVVAFERAL
jgi:FkbM family methyltransferase